MLISKEIPLIRHIVILFFRKSLCENCIGLLEATRPLVDQIPGIVSFQIISNDSKYVPEDVSSVGVEIIFEDQKAFDVFMHHPKHYEANAIFERYLADPPYAVLTHQV